MKLFKTLGVLFFAVMLFALSSCTTSFCSDADIASIKQGLRTQLDNNTGTGAYAQPDSAALSTAGITLDSLSEAGVVVTGIEELDWDALATLKNASGTDVSETYKDAYVDYLYDDVHPKACLVTNDHIDENSGGTIEGKSFSYAFRQGLLEILAFPFSWGIVGIGTLFGGGTYNGATLIIGIFLVTFIIRFVMIAATWKSTKQSQALQMLQPQINAINAKYANKNDAQSKQQKAMETMNLYKKYKINPISSIIGPFITLPVFIAIYCAVKDTTVIHEATIFNISLGAKVGENIMAFNWVAIVIFLLMIISQFLTMKLPQWVAKRNAPYAAKTPQAGQGFNQQSIMTYFFLIMIVVIGWMLPLAMSIYWIASSVFSIFQTFLMRKLTQLDLKRK